MKFTSIASFSHNLRTNAIFCLIFMIISSLQSVIWSVRILPQEKVKAVWNRQSLFVNCLKDPGNNEGALNWYREGYSEPIDENSQAPIYQQQAVDSVRLYLVNVPKKNSGNYSCRQTTNDNRVISKDMFELKVYNSIEMEGNKDSYVGTEGEGFSMPCIGRFDGDRDSTESQMSWIHNNNRIHNDQHFKVIPETKQSVNQKTIKSTLQINRLTKENEGTYTCESVYANPYFTDMKSIDINLRVQFKPRVPENTQRNVWIPDETSNSPVLVNITCLVNADPPAHFAWFSGHRELVNNGRGNGNRDYKHNLINTENMSVLSLEYDNIDKIRNRFNDQSKQFECRARNSIGEEKIMFELNVGKLPEQPILVNSTYEDGILSVIVNETRVLPPIDIYKIEISDKQHVYFNASHRNEAINNTYNIEVELPPGNHPINILAHNPVGWSPVQTDPELPPHYLLVSSAIVSHYSVAFVMIASLLGLLNTI